jgi:hypothetical protein
MLLLSLQRHRFHVSRLLSLAFAGAICSLSFPGSASATSIVCQSVAGNVIANCGFETGDLSGWTQGGNLGFTGVNGSLFVPASGDTYNPNSGSWQADLGPVGSDGMLSQTIATTPGDIYQIKFFMAGEGGNGSDFSAIFNGITLLATINPVQQFYTSYSYLQTATGTSTTLEFDFRNDTSFQVLDDVSVTDTSAPTLPEPGTWGLLSLGLAAAAAIARRRRAQTERL